MPRFMLKGHALLLSCGKDFEIFETFWKLASTQTFRYSECICGRERKMKDNVLQYRRCHVCGSTMEAADHIKKCSDCGKPFAPFYYFDDQTKPVLADSTLRPVGMQGEWGPIHGLTASWENF
jgi:hypothetical protein